MGNSEFTVDMGKRIQKQRKALGLTQEQVAEKMNISVQSLSCIELGKKAIRPENLCNLCKILGVTSDYLLMGTKSYDQLKGISQKFADLSDEDMKIIENLINRLTK
ncbi:MAG: helix-turn-helix transcriptional regulator [Clostridia bacterium]|nr:helix-turn-helix transcriptional regulator [Clostridia bacterium]